MKSITTIYKPIALLAIPVLIFIFNAHADSKIPDGLTPMGAEPGANKDGTIPGWKPAENKGSSYIPYSPKQDKNDKLIFTISSENYQEYEAHLTPGQIALFKTYPKTFSMHVFKSVRDYSAPEWVYEEIKNNYSCEGKVIYGGIPHLQPKTGLEAIENHLYRWQGITYSHQYDDVFVTNDGSSNAISYVTDIHSPYYDVSGSTDPVLFYKRTQTMGPPKYKGEMIITHQYTEESGRVADHWQYLPGTRRVRKAPTLSYDFPDNLSGGVRTIDDGDLFSGATDRYDWKLLEKKEIYIPYHNDRLEKVLPGKSDVFIKNHINPEYVRYELHRVWVVEATLKEGSRHVFPKRTLYLDEDSWSAVLSEKYNVENKLTRANMALYRQTHSSPAMFFPVNVYHDLENASYVVNGLTSSLQISENIPSMDNFSVAQVRKMGKRDGGGSSASLSASSGVGFHYAPPQSYDYSNEKYNPIASNGVVRVDEKPVSTFSVDVDTASYANVRNILQQYQTPPKDAVRVEEFINYFDYDYPVPESGEKPFSVVTELGPSPWNENNLLLHVGLKGYEVPFDNVPPLNLVFLIDVSGSMDQPNKLPLLKSAMSLLVSKLRNKDTVSIITYAGSPGIKLEPTAGNKQQAILDVLGNLNSGGSTGGFAALEQAYRLAEQTYNKKGINRIIIATDGDFNVGTTNTFDIAKFIESKRDTNVSITTLGFGRGNYRDELMEKIADVGNGNAFYIDSLSEANKVFNQELVGSMMIIAKDVKAQVEFNPDIVSEYRLIGYENRLLKREDFDNDEIDAGDIGSGHTVTALYEISLKGSGGEKISPLRYSKEIESKGKHPDELAFLKLRYKKPDDKDSILIESPILFSTRKDAIDNTSENFRFSAAVAGFGQLLMGGEYTDKFSYDDVISLSKDSVGKDEKGYRQGFTSLVSNWLEMKDHPERWPSQNYSSSFIQPGYVRPTSPKRSRGACTVTK